MKEFADKVMSTPHDGACLFSVGQAGYILKSSNGKLLGIDLYLSDYSERDEGHIGFKRMLPKILGTKELVFDYLVCTHPHSDHFDYDSAYELMDNGKTVMFASMDCKKLVNALGVDENRVVYVKPGDSHTVDDFTVHFLNCDHGDGAPDAVGVIAEVDGKRVFEAGDTCLRLDRVGEILSHGEIDVMIAPINGAYGNLNEEDNARLTAEVKPKLAIPCHYGMFASHFGLPGLYMKYMKELCPEQKYMILTQGEFVKL